MSAQAKSIVVILGMHRSGTSMLANQAAALGVDFGQNLMPATEDNQGGYFEDVRIVELNDALLHALHGNWDSWRFLDATEFESESIAPLFQEALALIEEMIQAGGVIGFKDPRVSLLLPFWKRVFAEKGIKASYVISNRNPDEIAQSLAKRDDFWPLKSYLLWYRYLRSALCQTRGERACLLSYHEFLQRPEEMIDLLAEFLGIEDADLIEKAKRESPIKLELRRNRSDGEQRHSWFTGGFAFLEEFYQAVEALSQGELKIENDQFCIDDTSLLAQAQVGLDRIEALSPNPFVELQKLHRRKEIIRMKNARIADFKEIIQGKNREIIQLTKALDNLKARQKK